MEDFDLNDFDFGEFENTAGNVVDLNKPLEKTPDIGDIITTLRKRSMVVFFVVDISGSMRGARIGAVNDAIRNVLPELKKKEKGNTAAEIKIAILEFSTNARWKTPEPQSLSNFNYEDITEVYGCTNFGTAFHELNEKLSKNEFLNSSAGAYTPLIILLTDGKPSDIMMYHEELELLKRNKWFKYATRAGIAIEEGALSPECKKVLMEFTENEKNVYEAKNTIILAKQIQLVTLVGVDFVTQQGSLQNSPSTAASSQAAPFNTHQSRIDLTRHNNGTSQQTATTKNNIAFNNNPQSAVPRNSVPTQPTDLPSMPEMTPIQPEPRTNQQSPTLPIGEIDWENDFNF